MANSSLLLVTGAGPKLAPFYAAMHCDYREAGATYFAIGHPAAMLAITRDSETSCVAKILRLGVRVQTLKKVGDETDDLIEHVLPPFTSRPTDLRLI